MIHHHPHQLKTEEVQEQAAVSECPPVTHKILCPSTRRVSIPGSEADSGALTSSHPSTTLSQTFVRHGSCGLHHGGSPVDAAARASDYADSEPRSTCLTRYNSSQSPVVETHRVRVTTTRRGYRKVNQYRLDTLLGAGSFSEVFLAADDQRNPYAIKIIDRQRFLKRNALRPSADRLYFEEKIMLEIAVLKRLRHPNIIALHEVIDDPESKELFLVLELAMCGPIMMLTEDGHVIPDNGGETHLPEAEAARIAKALVGALRYAHYQGVAHRDIKPQNILLSEDYEVKLADFGVSKMIREWDAAASSSSFSSRQQSQHLTNDSMDAAMVEDYAAGCDNDDDDGDDVPGDEAYVLGVAGRFKVPYRSAGTVCFMAPEFLDPRRHEGDELEIRDFFYADVWSFGVTMYALSIGELPWKANTASGLFDAIQSTAITGLPFPSGCAASPELRDFLSCCINTVPQERPMFWKLARHPWLHPNGRENLSIAGSLVGSSFMGSFPIPRSVSAQSSGIPGGSTEAAPFSNFSFDGRLPRPINLGLSMSFTESPVRVTQTEVSRAITFRQSLSSSQRAPHNTEDSLNGGETAGSPPLVRCSKPVPIYSALHTTSPPAQWFTPSPPRGTLAVHIDPSAAPVDIGNPMLPVQLDPLEITNDDVDEATRDDCSCHTTPSRRISGQTTTPQGSSLCAVSHPSQNGEMEALRDVFSSHICDRSPDPPAVLSPPDPASLSATETFASRETSRGAASPSGASNAPS